MQPISFKRHRFPGEVILHAVWLYFRFTLSIRDVEELMAQRGLLVSREAIRCWVNKFGPLIAANLRKGRPCPTGRWRLDDPKGGEARWFARSAGVACIFGVPLTTKARCSTFWFRSGATSTRP
jgi:transposase-like protein